VAHEVADAAAWFQDRGVAAYAQPADGVVDRRDDGGRRIEGVEGRALGAVVLLASEQRFQFFAKGLPTVLKLAGDRIGKNREGYRPETGEAAKYLFFLGSRGPLLPFDGRQRADGRDDVASLALLAAGDAAIDRSCGVCGGIRLTEGWRCLGCDRRSSGRFVGEGRGLIGSGLFGERIKKASLATLPV
jgi:hypothetical protein